MEKTPKISERGRELIEMRDLLKNVPSQQLHANHFLREDINGRRTGCAIGWCVSLSGMKMKKKEFKDDAIEYGHFYPVSESGEEVISWLPAAERRWPLCARVVERVNQNILKSCDEWPAPTERYVLVMEWLTKEIARETTHA